MNWLLLSTTLVTLVFSAVDKEIEVVTTKPIPVESCKNIDKYNSHQKYKLVDSCDGVQADLVTAKKCADISVTVVGKIPVTNLKTGVTFQNIYCAICHGQYSEITRWQLSVRCSSYSKVIKIWNVNSVNECQQVIIKPDFVPLKQCNGYRYRRRKRQARLKEKSNIHGTFSLGYTTLLNFGVDGSAHTLYTSAAEQYLYENECTATQIFNPFEQVCIETTCPDNHISIKGKCVGQQVVSKDANAGCIDFNICYILSDELLDEDEENFKKNLVSQFLAHYHVRLQNIVLPSKLYDNSSQCTNDSNFESSFLMWNMSDISAFSPLESQNFSTSKMFWFEKELTCSNLTDNESNLRTGNFVVSLKFTNVDPKLGKVQDLLNIVGNNESSLFHVKDSSNVSTGYGCVSTAKLHNQDNVWCQGFKNEYFNDEFELLTMGSRPDELNITGIKISATNKIYSISQFQYTAVVGNGTFWRNITQMASTCDKLPHIKATEDLCIMLPLEPSKYEMLPNRSIRVAEFEELSGIEMPFQNGPSKPIQNIFSLDEYEYIWNHTQTSSTTFSLDNLLNDQMVSICIPLPLLTFFIELELWNSVNIKSSCAFLQNFGWGSSIAGFVFSAISMLAMIVVLVTYSIFRTLRTLPGISLMNLTVAVMLSQITFMSGLLIPTSLDDDSYRCFVMAVVTHYCILCSFMWMNVMAYSSYRAFGADFKTQLTQLTNKHVMFNSLYGWGIPAVIVLTCAIVDYTYREDRLIAYGVVSDVKVFTEKNATTGLIDDIQVRYRTMSTCWIANSKAAAVIFGAPLVYSVVVNLVLFIRTCIGMRDRKRGRPKTRLRRDSGSGHVKSRNEMSIHLRLSAQYGFAWIFAVIIIVIGTSRTENAAICYVLYILNLIFNILNGCTGLFIFFAFIFNRRILHLYKAKFSRYNSKYSKTNISRLSTSSSRISNIS